MRTSSLTASSLVLALAAGLALLAPACGSSDDSSLFTDLDAGNDGDPYARTNGDGSFGRNLDANADLDALFAADPPAQWCGPETGVAPPPLPGGSVDCPSDKNIEGCPCTTGGQTAACWPGHRRNRDVGVCKDGQTTCIKNTEVGAVWGPCVGAVLPDPNGSTPASKCECFSQGQWHIENLRPYFVTYTSAGGVSTTYGMSTSQDPDGGASVDPTFPQSPPPPVPSEVWSKDDLTVDCAGTFTLCFEIKAGDITHPSPSDCSVAKVCLPSTFYPTANVKQPMPVMPAWLADASHSACSDNFHQNGGYGEMSVLGQSVICDQIDDGSGGSLVFNRIKYCPASVTNCGQDGSGTFH